MVGCCIVYVLVLAAAAAAAVAAAEVASNKAPSTSTLLLHRRQGYISTRHRLSQLGIPVESSEPIVDRYDMQYFGEIRFGSEHHPVEVQLDTGSSNLWITSTDCVAYKNQPQQFHLCYYPTNVSASTSIKDLHRKFHFAYGSGSIHGNLVEDNLRWAGLSIHGYRMGVANTLNGDGFYGFLGGGILGLGFSRLASKGLMPIFERAVNDKLLPTAAFAMNLTRVEGKGTVKSHDGTLILGVSNDFLGERVQWHSLKEAAFWMVTGNVRMGQASYSGNMIVDSGTSMIAMPRSFIAHVWSEVQSDLPYTGIIECSKASHMLKNLVVSIGFYDYTLTPEDLIVRTEIDDQCLVGFMIVPDNTPFMILGDNFMTRVGHEVTIFDMNSQRIGLTGGTDRPIWDVISVQEWVVIGFIIFLLFSLLILISRFTYFCFLSRNHRNQLPEALLTDQHRQNP